MACLSVCLFVIIVVCADLFACTIPYFYFFTFPFIYISRVYSILFYFLLIPVSLLSLGTYIFISAC